MAGLYWCDSRKGSRPENQDTELIFDNLDFHLPQYSQIRILGIFDGHGKHGLAASQTTANLYKNALLNVKLKFPLSGQEIGQISDYVNATLNKMVDTTQSGSTGLITVIYLKTRSRKEDSDGETSDEDSDDDTVDAGKPFLQIINTGDCRAMLCRGGLGIPLTRDQKPGTYYERNRITNLLKKYNGHKEKVHRTAKLEMDKAGDWRICNMSVSRAYGDLHATPYVTHHPEYYNGYSLSPSTNFLMLACDGIWDVFATEEIADLVMSHMVPDPHTMQPVLKNSSKNMAKIICKEALRRGSTDNVSCIIAFC
jgi:serine/threonine protein phosphatase PrpC